MIRINLLPFRAARRREDIRQQISIFVLLIICLILGLSYYSIFLDKKIDRINNQIVSVDKDIARYKEKANKVNVIKKAISTYKKKVAIIKALKNRRREIIVLLDNLTELVIPERMWLTGLQIKQSSVDISGTAFDQKTVADFMTKIEKSQFFTKNIKLNNLKLGTANGVTVQKFTLTCTRAATKK